MFFELKSCWQRCIYRNINTTTKKNQRDSYGGGEVEWQKINYSMPNLVCDIPPPFFFILKVFIPSHINKFPQYKGNSVDLLWHKCLVVGSNKGQYSLLIKGFLTPIPLHSNLIWNFYHALLGFSILNILLIIYILLSIFIFLLFHPIIHQLFILNVYFYIIIFLIYHDSYQNRYFPT